MEDNKIIDNIYKDKKIIYDIYNEDKIYIKEKTLGRGAEGVAYLVSKKDTNLQYVAKIIEGKENQDKKEYVENEKFKKEMKETIRMFNKISSIESSYIIGCKGEGKCEIKKNDKVLKIRQYFIYEHAQNGDLWKIIAATGGFGERCSKLIFKKILLGVQTLHKNGIYHLDLKIDNILIDNKHNPKICDFGFATDKQGKLKVFRGTKNYKAPQMFLKKEYLGVKADIFSLGVIVFYLVVGKDTFKRAKAKDALYNLIILKKKQVYFDTLCDIYEEIKSLNLTKEFKDLYCSMIAFEEEDRPENIGEVLKDKWFNEIENLDDKQKQDLENEVEAKFTEKENKIKHSLEIKKKKTNINDDSCYFGKYYRDSDNKGASKEEDNQYFKPYFNLENKSIKLDGDFYIKLLGNFDYCAFMNDFVKEILKKYKDGKESVFINNIKENYKCNIEFQKDEDDIEDNEDDEDNENKDLIIRLNLYRSGDKEVILRFLKKSGDLDEYNEKLLDIISLAQELNKKEY